MDRETMCRVLGLAERNAERLLQMVETLVDIGRLEAGQMPLGKQVVCVGSIFEEGLSQVSPQAQAKGIRLEAEASPGLTVWADPGLSRRVIANLLGNAVSSRRRGVK